MFYPVRAIALRRQKQTCMGKSVRISAHVFNPLMCVMRPSRIRYFISKLPLSKPKIPSKPWNRDQRRWQPLRLWLIFYLAPSENSYLNAALLLYDVIKLIFNLTCREIGREQSDCVRFFCVTANVVNIFFLQYLINISYKRLELQHKACLFTKLKPQRCTIL